MPNQGFAETARALRDPELRTARYRGAQSEPSVVEINRLIWRISKDVQRTGELPYVDPTFGGVAAEVVLVLKAPQADADPKLGDQRLISLDNDDEGAAHLFKLMRDLGIDRQRCVPWNICPFPPDRFDPVAGELERSRPYFGKFMDLIEAPEVVLVLGAAARRGWEQFDFVDLTRGCRVVYGPSPSPPGIDERGALNRLRDALVDAFEIEV